MMSINREMILKDKYNRQMVKTKNPMRGINCKEIKKLLKTTNIIVSNKNFSCRKMKNS